VQQIPFKMYAVLGTWMEADIVVATIRNALTQGCERIYLVDNNSSDKTVSLACGEGAILARSYETKEYDEIRRLNEMNSVVSEVSGRENLAIWWLYLDADEFPHGSNGLTVREHLERIDPRCRIVGLRFFNHYPSGKPEYVYGCHPLDFQPLCEEFKFPMCRHNHYKHSLQRFDPGRPPITCGAGFHSGSCAEDLIEAEEPAFLHHFPFRDELTTRRKLERLWESHGTQHRRASAKRDTHMLTRFLSLDAVYSQQWSKVKNYAAIDPIGAKIDGPTPLFGISPSHWNDLVDAGHQRIRRWY
jgi:Glycosyl transferase family 2